MEISGGAPSRVLTLAGMAVASVAIARMHATKYALITTLMFAIW